MDTRCISQSGADSTQSLLQLRNENCLTDLDLECVDSQGTEVVSVHGVLFAAQSKYFKALLSEPWGQPMQGTRRTTSLHMPSEIVNVLVHAVYTGYLDLTEDNMSSILLASLELDFQVFAQCAAQYIKQHTSETTVCCILETAVQMYDEDLVHWCAKFIAERLLSPPVDAKFLDNVWRLDCFESVVKSSKALSDVDCFVLILGWASYAWGERCSRLTQLLCDSVCGADLRRLCTLACCSQEVRLELLDTAALESVAEAATTPQTVPGTAPGDVRQHEAVHVPDRHGQQTTDTIGSTPGSYGSAMSQHGIGACSMCGDEQFAAACQSAVDELTAWPAAGKQSSVQHHVHVLAHGLVPALGFQECQDALRLHTDQQPCRDRASLSRSVDACTMFDSHGAHAMSSLDSGMLGETYHGRGHADSCAERPSPAVGSIGRLGHSFGEASSCREPDQSILDDVDCRCGWEDVGARSGAPQGQSIFVCGGRDHSWRGSTTGLQYCPSRDRWSTCGAPLCNGVTFASIASLQETVFLFGNSAPPLSCMPRSDTPWTPLPTAPFTTGLQFPSVEAVSDRIIVAGGRSLPNRVHDDCWVLDLTTMSWATCPSLTTARYSAASATFGSLLVVSGGQDKVNVLCTVEGLDAERGWISLPDLSGARKYHSMQSVRRYYSECTERTLVEARCRRLYCFGGKSFDSRRQTVVEALDPREGKWSVVAHMQDPRSSFGCVAVEGLVFIIGGNDAAARPISSVTCFDPLMNSWNDKEQLPVEISGLGACVMGS